MTLLSIGDNASKCRQANEISFKTLGKVRHFPQQVQIREYVYSDHPLMMASAAERLSTKKYNKLLSPNWVYSEI